MTSHRDLTTGPIGSHLLALAVPAAMGMIFNTLYNLTDFWFAGKLSDDALAGVSIAGSVFFLILSGSIGMQTGTTAIVATEVGKGNTASVADWVNQATGLGLMLSVVCLVIGLLCTDPLIKFLGAEPQVQPLARSYVVIVLWGCFTFVLSGVAAGALMALGDTVSNRNALAVGLLANFILNPILIFGLNLHVSGLAIATVLIKLASVIYLYSVIKKQLGSWARPAFNIQRWGELMRQVAPASFNMLTVILGGFITVSFIGSFGSQSVAGYATGLRLEQLLLLPALGLNTAVMALVGQNFGANKIERIQETYKKALITGLGIALFSIPVMIFLSPTLLGFFSSNEQMIKTGTTYLRIDALAFFAYVVMFVSVATLQAVKKPMFPMYLGLARQLILPATINYILIVVLDLPMICLFISIVVIVICSALLSHWYTSREIGKLTRADSADSTAQGGSNLVSKPAN